MKNNNYELKTHYKYKTGKIDRTNILVTEYCNTEALLDVFETGWQVYESFPHILVRYNYHNLKQLHLV